MNKHFVLLTSFICLSASFSLTAEGTSFASRFLARAQELKTAALDKIKAGTERLKKALPEISEKQKEATLGSLKLAVVLGQAYCLYEHYQLGCHARNILKQDETKVAADYFANRSPKTIADLQKEKSQARFNLLYLALATPTISYVAYNLGKQIHSHFKKAFAKPAPKEEAAKEEAALV